MAEIAKQIRYAYSHIFHLMACIMVIWLHDIHAGNQSVQWLYSVYCVLVFAYYAENNILWVIPFKLIYKLTVIKF